MDFSSRGFQRSGTPQAATPSAPAAHGAGTPAGSPKKGLKIGGASSVPKLYILFFVALLVLVVASILALSTKDTSSQASYIDKNNYQVVAFTDKQAYFGKITKVTDNYIVLTDVFYLQDSNSSQSSNSSTLIKRGCEIHRPQDQMVIYKDQVNFWENLQGDSKVVQTIKDFKKKYPKGQDCNALTTPAQSSTQQSSTTPSTTTTPTQSTTNSSSTKSSGSTSTGTGSTGTTQP